MGKHPDSLKAVMALNSAGEDISLTGAAGGTSMVDDAPFTPGGSALTPMGALADETLPDAVDEGDIGVPRMNPTTRVLYAQLKDAAGADVAVGGGTQYTEGATDASITGTAILHEDAADTLVTVSAAKPLPVVQTGALPAGTNAIGKLAANSGVDIGDVDVTSLPALPAGDNNIGNVDVASLPATPAGTNLIGRVSSSPETSTIYNGTTALTPKFAPANVAASQTDSNIVTAVASKKIRVLALVAVAGATATNLTFNTKPAGAGTAISPLFANGANGGVVLPFSQVGWFETASGEGLTVTTGAGSTTGIQVVYAEV